MKIVTCITRLIRGGAQRLALETAALLAARGHDSELWCGPETGPEGSLHEEAAARGVRIRIFPHLRRAIDPWHDARALANLARALRETRPDLLHTHSSKAGILGRDAAHRVGVPRVIHTVHGWGFTPRTPAWKTALYVSLEKRCAPVGPLVFVNPADREDGRRRGIIGPPGSRVIAPGIDLSPYLGPERPSTSGSGVRKSLGLTPATILGGFLGRLSAQKAPEILLEVANVTARHATEIHWLVVGDGPMGRELQARAAALPFLAGRIHWAGLQAEPAPWLAAMDFLVLPSRWEGTPLTVMEAMAAGLPVIGSDLPGVRWALDGTPDCVSQDEGRNGGTRWPTPPRQAGKAGKARDAGETGPTTGILVQPDDVRSFAAAVEALAGDGEARRRFGAAGREVARERFGLDRMVEKLLDLYAPSA